jgi:hypothetical protein
MNSNQFSIQPKQGTDQFWLLRRQEGKLRPMKDVTKEVLECLVAHLIDNPDERPVDYVMSFSDGVQAWISVRLQKPDQRPIEDLEHVIRAALDGSVNLNDAPAAIADAIRAQGWIAGMKEGQADEQG